ncbi:MULTISPECIES: helix-turn-helix domain-containing protein [Bacillaceae]|uniref:helix-turn-helix domain-containing protein n=1 Tax=Bacillaceae TaxID=186817 RepID=UPI0018DDFE04|nr:MULTISPECIES: helix-turn-helix domain-containing protein [Rossellomorea]MBH9965601.1 helix-turn-helix domain-containing protein [[Bacillus] enclensis]MBW3111226.1 helix-turn-helix domain-containing protein [Bacillus sp. MCCB 382]MDX8345234.1 helix-turn-helix domain-containing protein [Rossellomorea sp. YZS02]
MGKSIESYPIVLKASHIAEILGVSEPTAYKLMREKDFPLINILGRNMRALRNEFFNWLEEKSNNS